MDDKTLMQDAAIAVFRQPPLKYNCAQAVLHGYRAAHPDFPLIPADFQNHGGGRAPDGLCGALWAACEIRFAKAGALRADFKAKAGAIYCRELKRECGAGCHDNVRLALGLLAGE